MKANYFLSILLLFTSLFSPLILTSPGSVLCQHRHKKLFLTILMVAVGVASSLGISVQGQGVNLVKEEMITPDFAFKKIIDMP